MVTKKVGMKKIFWSCFRKFSFNVLEDLQLITGYPFAHYKIQRIIYSENLYIEASEIGKDDFYLIGTLNMKNNINIAKIENIFNNQVIIPVRSKVIEYLFYRNPKLYEQITKYGIVPSREYLYKEK